VDRSRRTRNRPTLRLPVSLGYSGQRQRLDSFTVAGAAPELRQHCVQVRSLTGFIIIKEGSIEEIIMKIRRMAYVDRCYISQKTGKYINSECMVMYIDLEPRSSIKAMNELFKQYNDELVLNAFGLKDKNYRNLKRYLSWSKIRSVLAKNKSRRLYCDIDIDIKDEILLNEILHIVSKLNNKICIETKNG